MSERSCELDVDFESSTTSPDRVVLSIGLPDDLGLRRGEPA